MGRVQTEVQIIKRIPSSPAANKLRNMAEMIDRGMFGDDIDARVDAFVAGSVQPDLKRRGAKNNDTTNKGN